MSDQSLRCLLKKYLLIPRKIEDVSARMWLSPFLSTSVLKVYLGTYNLIYTALQ